MSNAMRLVELGFLGILAVCAGAAAIAKGNYGFTLTFGTLFLLVVRALIGD